MRAPAALARCPGGADRPARRSARSAAAESPARRGSAPHIDRIVPPPHISTDPPRCRFLHAAIPRLASPASRRSLLPRRELLDRLRAEGLPLRDQRPGLSYPAEEPPHRAL